MVLSNKERATKLVRGIKMTICLTLINEESERKMILNNVVSFYSGVDFVSFRFEDGITYSYKAAEFKILFINCLRKEIEI